MAMPNVFVDTSGFFALLVQRDPAHKRAVQLVSEWQLVGRQTFTSDYIVDETATLLKMRGHGSLLSSFFSLLDSSEALGLVFVDEERFGKTKEFLLKHQDHGYSFTDCSSFLLMKQFGSTESLTTDVHFREAGFRALLI